MLTQLQVSSEYYIRPGQSVLKKKRKIIARTQPVIKNAGTGKLVKQSSGLKEEAIFTGLIQSITPFGIFITVASKKCLLHISSLTGLTSQELKKRQISRFFSINEKISVKVNLISNGKISLNWIINNDESHKKAQDILTRFKHNTEEHDKVRKALSTSCTDKYKLQ